MLRPGLGTSVRSFPLIRCKRKKNVNSYSIFLKKKFKAIEKLDLTGFYSNWFKYVLT